MKEELRIKPRDDITRWSKYTKADFMLRDGDIQSLVEIIMSEIYPENKDGLVRDFQLEEMG